jgi:hypothetical protein
MLLNKGTKYRWTQMVRINTPGVNNGHLEHWIDWQRVFLSTTIEWRGPGVATSAARITGWEPHIYSGGNACDGPTYDSYVKVGRFYVRDTAPNFATPLAD